MIAPLTVKLPASVKVTLLEIASELHEYVPSTVGAYVVPPPIFTASAEPGTTPLDQLAALVQLALVPPTQVIVAAVLFCKPPININIISKNINRFFKAIRLTTCLFKKHAENQYTF